MGMFENCRRQTFHVVICHWVVRCSSHGYCLPAVTSTGHVVGVTIYVLYASSGCQLSKNKCVLTSLTISCYSNK